MYFELCISYTEGQDNQQTKHEFEVEAVLHQKEKYTQKKPLQKSPKQSDSKPYVHRRATLNGRPHLI